MPNEEKRDETFRRRGRADARRRGALPARLRDAVENPPRNLRRAVLGQPLQFTVPVHLNDDESLGGHFAVATGRFVTKPGEYTVYVGNSADNTPHTATLTVGS